MNNVIKLILASAIFAFSLSVSAAPVILGNSTNCSVGNAIEGIAIGDVFGNNGGATDCWGTFDGNDPGPSGDGFDIDGTIFDFVAKKDIGGSLSGTDIGLVVGSNGSTGTWSYDSAKFDPNEFLIVLKAADSPGYATWLFTGVDAASDAGEWLVAWTVGNGPNPSNPDLSHLSVYAAVVPVPAALWLFGSGLIALVGFARRKA